MKREKASASSISLIFILSIAILVSALIYTLNPIRNRNNYFSSYLEQRSLLWNVGYKVIEAMKTDETPNANWSGDAIWDSLEEIAEEFESEHEFAVELSLRDVSSKLNPNWMRTLLFERTELSSTLARGQSPDTLKQYRDDFGYNPNIHTHYIDLIKEENLEELFTGYSFLNINVSYEAALEDFYFMRTRDEVGASLFRQKIQNQLANLELFTLEDLKETLGDNYYEVSPFINNEALMNINFVPERLIFEILSYPFGGKSIENHRTIATNIIQSRENQEINEESLRGYIPVQEDAHQRIFFYFGAKTWFWELTITPVSENAIPSLGLRLIIVRLPTDTSQATESGQDTGSYVIFEEDYFNPLLVQEEEEF